MVSWARISGKPAWADHCEINPELGPNLDRDANRTLAAIGRGRMASDRRCERLMSAKKVYRKNYGLVGDKDGDKFRWKVLEHWA